MVSGTLVSQGALRPDSLYIFRVERPEVSGVGNNSEQLLVHSPRRHGRERDNETEIRRRQDKENT